MASLGRSFSAILSPVKQKLFRNLYFDVQVIYSTQDFLIMILSVNLNYEFRLIVEQMLEFPFLLKPSGWRGLIWRRKSSNWMTAWATALWPWKSLTVLRKEEKMTTSLWIWCMNALLFNRGRSTEEWGLILYSRTPILRFHWDW